MSYGVNVQGVSVQGVSDRGVCVLGVSVRGVHVRGGVCPVTILVRCKPFSSQPSMN